MNNKEIESYIHCGLCIQDDTLSQDIEVGWTEAGLQIWCRIHDCNIVNIDFEGKQLPADVTRNFIPEIDMKIVKKE